MMDELNVTATPGFLKSPPLRSPLVDIDTNVSKDDTPTWLKTASAVCDLDKVLNLAEVDAAADAMRRMVPPSESQQQLAEANHRQPAQEIWEPQQPTASSTSEEQLGVITKSSQRHQSAVHVGF